MPVPSVRVVPAARTGLPRGECHHEGAQGRTLAGRGERPVPRRDQRCLLPLPALSDPKLPPLAPIRGPPPCTPQPSATTSPPVRRPTRPTATAPTCSPRTPSRGGRCCATA